MRLLALSDLHLGSPTNRDALEALPFYPDDWLIVAGDVAESFARIGDGLAALRRRFAKVIWVPGNHELWCLPGGDDGLRGQARYDALVELAHRHDVLTPEDPCPLWEGPGGPAWIAPLFTLYDYSFGPPGLSVAEVIAWAAEANIHPVDEVLLHPDPFASRQEWCDARLFASLARLEALPADQATILVSHWPLRQDLVQIPRVPRFAPWCGSSRTAGWPQRFRAIACVHGHLHVRGRFWREGIRFEEASLGYPRQWEPDRGMAPYIRQILPFMAQPDDP